MTTNPPDPLRVSQGDRLDRIERILEATASNQLEERNRRLKFRVARDGKYEAAVGRDLIEQGKVMSNLYEQDFYGWTQEQAVLLRQGKLTQLDIENLIEEIESLGRQERRELVNRLVVLLQHLLKWEFQPAYRSRSWEATIKIQRLEVAKLLEQNPSLCPYMPEAIADAYLRAVVEVYGETGISADKLPMTCPYSVEQISDSEFFPNPDNESESKSN